MVHKDQPFCELVTKEEVRKTLLIAMDEYS